MSLATLQLNQILSELLGEKDIKIHQQSGGCINQCLKIETSNEKYFCKINTVSKLPHLFEVEAKGLKLIEGAKVFKTPRVIDIFYKNDYQILLLEWIDEGLRTPGFWKKFGEALAELHSNTNKDYGLDIDNYMGNVQQENNPHDDWTSFFISKRLQPLIHACKEKKLISSVHEQKFQDLFSKLHLFFHNVKPSLVHGDLWSGNFMCNKNEEPVLIDPAVYYGIPAVDIGMTKLFGGFNQLFYESYQKHSIIYPDENQNKICNLYPLLIHLFLFGKTYLPQIEETLKDFK